MNTERNLRFWLWDLIELGNELEHFKTVQHGHREVKIYFSPRFVVGIIFQHGKHILTRRFARGPHDSLLGYEYTLCSNAMQQLAA
jgi:hypothetical protein